MWRPLVACQALRVFPIPTAFRADSAGLKGIPQVPASRTTHPTVKGQRNPFALRAKDFDFSHVSPSSPNQNSDRSLNLAIVTMHLQCLFAGRNIARSWNFETLSVMLSIAGKTQ